MRPSNHPDRSPAAWACALVAALLAACSEGVPVPEPEFPEVMTVSEVQVLDASRGGTVAHTRRTARGDDARLGWTATRQDAPLKSLSDEEMDGYDRVEGGLSRNGTLLWWAQNVDPGERVRLCYRRTDDQREHCAEEQLELTNPDRLRIKMVRTLEVDDEGDAMLLAEAQGRWMSMWMRPGNTPMVRRHDLPRGVQDPVLLHHGEVARLVWLEGDTLQVLEMSDATLNWRQRLSAAGTGPWWMAAVQAGREGWSWLVSCTGPSPRVQRLSAGDTRTLPRPPLPDCPALVGRPLLAVADNGNAMLAWKQDDELWRAVHWNGATETWAEPTVLEGVRHRPRLLPDASGHFALLSSSTDGALRLWVWRPDGGWQPPIELDPSPQAYGRGSPSGTEPDCCASMAVAQGRAVVAWVRNAPGNDPATPLATGTRLATADVNLARTYGTLVVQVEGAGRVSSTPAGIDCPADCRLDLPVGTYVRLQATPAQGQRVAGWSGYCVELTPTTAELALYAEGGTCRVRFEPQPTQALDVVVQGTGSVSADPPGPLYPTGTEVTLTAMPGAGQRFVAWGGDADCADGRVTMDGPRHCIATFEPDPALVALTLAVSGGGRVFSNPAGLVCTGSCTAYFPAGQRVVLTAEPPADTSTVWSGGCSGTGLTATVELTTALVCNVGFVPVAASGWQTLGGNLPGGGGLRMRPAIATNAQGVPTVAFLTQVAELAQLDVLRLVGAGWQRVGSGPLNDAFVSAGQPSIAMDAQGRPLVAFADVNGRLQLRHWDGSQWRRLADGLAVRAGNLTGAPQVVFDGQRAVVAFLEYGSNGQVQLALMRSALDTPNWTGGTVNGVVLSGGAELRLTLDTSGAARIAYVTGSGVQGEQAPRVVQETGAGWAPLCDGGVGDAAGNNYAVTQLGLGLQTAADGAALVVRPRSDFRGVQAWRCSGSGPWVTEGGADGRLADVDNVLTYLQGMAMASSGVPTLSVMVDNGYDGTAEVQVYGHGFRGFTLLGLPLRLPQRVSLGQLAVAPGARGAPVVAYGVEANSGRVELQAARYRP